MTFCAAAVIRIQVAPAIVALAASRVAVTCAMRFTAVAAWKLGFATVEPAIGGRAFALACVLVADALARFAAAVVRAGYGGDGAVETRPRGIARTRSSVDMASPVASAAVGTGKDGAGTAQTVPAELAGAGAGKLRWFYFFLKMTYV